MDSLDELILREQRRLRDERDEILLALMRGDGATSAELSRVAKRADIVPMVAPTLSPADEVERVYMLNVFGGPDEIYDLFSCRSYLQSELAALLEKLQSADSAGSQAVTLELVHAIQAVDLWLGGLRWLVGLVDERSLDRSVH